MAVNVFLMDKITQLKYFSTFTIPQDTCRFWQNDPNRLEKIYIPQQKGFNSS